MLVFSSTHAFLYSESKPWCDVHSHALSSSHAISCKPFLQLFDFIDADKSGEISVEEFESMFAELGISTTRADMDNIFRLVSKNPNTAGEGDIDDVEL